MKKLKLFSVLMVIMLALSVNAFADSWKCLNCGNENSRNYCPVCGMQKPKAWICSACHSLYSQNYCEDCGAIRNSGVTVDSVIIMHNDSMQPSI